MEIGGQKPADLFTARAEAVAAKVSRVADIASAERLIAEEKMPRQAVPQFAF